MSAVPRPGVAASTTNVSYGYPFFNPKVVKINVGDTVHWSGGGNHTLLGTGTDPICGGASLPCSHQFNTAGSFPYECTVPGHASAGMTGLVVVAGSPPLSPAVLTNMTFMVGGQFRFTLVTTADHTNIIQASSDLGGSAGWVSIATNVPSSSSLTFTDANAGAFSSRFYRVIEPR